MSILPTKQRSFRLSDRSVAHLERLADRLNRNQTDVVELALAHLLATLERDERVHLTPPSDEADPDIGRD